MITCSDTVFYKKKHIISIYNKTRYDNTLYHTVVRDTESQTHNEELD